MSDVENVRMENVELPLRLKVDDAWRTVSCGAVIFDFRTGHIVILDVYHEGEDPVVLRAEFYRDILNKPWYREFTELDWSTQ